MVYIQFGELWLKTSVNGPKPKDTQGVRARQWPNWNYKIRWDMFGTSSKKEGEKKKQEEEIIESIRLVKKTGFTFAACVSSTMKQRRRRTKMMTEGCGTPKKKSAVNSVRNVGKRALSVQFTMICLSCLQNLFPCLVLSQSKWNLPLFPFSTLITACP